MYLQVWNCLCSWTNESWLVFKVACRIHSKISFSLYKSVNFYLSQCITHFRGTLVRRLYGWCTHIHTHIKMENLYKWNIQWKSLSKKVPLTHLSPQENMMHRSTSIPASFLDYFSLFFLCHASSIYFFYSATHWLTHSLNDLFTHSIIDSFTYSLDQLLTHHSLITHWLSSHSLTHLLITNSMTNHSLTDLLTHH